ncbi:MAG: hypothetical protein EOO75_04465 [Myxococcales bacterium]|nr:MAG: hypothetical protein EOO75_04465 [Myxococcales bacterium]
MSDRRPRSGTLSRPLAALCLASLALPGGCKDVSDYSTAPDESYCGSVVQGPFVRSGLDPSVQMRLRLDADALATAPGVITTSDGLLADAALQVVPQVFNDPLSTMQFGEGRRRNLVYTALPQDGTAAVLVVLSLMESGDVEARLLRGPAASSAPPAIFGVFPLQRRKGACGL